MTLPGECIVWCEPFTQSCRDGRKDARVRPEEVPKALDFFKKQLGHAPVAVCLNKDMIETLGNAFPEGVEIIKTNVASWEILALDDREKPKPADKRLPEALEPVKTTQDIDTPVTISDKQAQPVPIIPADGMPVRVPYHRRGQATVYDPIIDKEIAGGGSYRQISKRLRELGILFSHMSVKRRMEV